MCFYDRQDKVQQPEQKWYESLWGLVLLTVGMNLFSNWLYDRSQQRIRKQDQYKERRRERKHLEIHHGKSEQEAILEESEIYNQID